MFASYRGNDKQKTMKLTVKRSQLPESVPSKKKQLSGNFLFRRSVRIWQRLCKNRYCEMQSEIREQRKNVAKG